MCDISRSTACKTGETGSAEGITKDTKDSRRCPSSRRLHSKDRGDIEYDITYPQLIYTCSG